MTSGVRNRLFVGLLLLALGGVFLTENLTNFEFDWGDWWPAILIILGVVSLPSSRWAGVVLVLVGAVFLVDGLDVIDVDIGDFWPVALIAVGLWVLVGGWRRKERSGRAGESPLDELDVSSVFGGAEQRVTSQQFRGGKVSATFGSAAIDLRGAGLAGGTATLHIEAVFGSAEVYVPADWAVNVQASGNFGGVEVKRPQPSSPSATLTVTGSCTFGGITIV